MLLNMKKLQCSKPHPLLQLDRKCSFSYFHGKHFHLCERENNIRNFNFAKYKFFAKKICVATLPLANKGKNWQENATFAQ